MPQKKWPTLMGMNNVAEDAALEIGGKAPALYFKDAVNVDFTESGRVKMRAGMAQQTAQAYRYIWQSPLHQDCFALLDDQWVLVNIQDWSHSVLCEIGTGPITHMVLNNQVCVCGEAGLFIYDGQQAKRLTIETPAAVQLSRFEDGSVPTGEYHCAISWLRHGQESGISEISTIHLSESAQVEVQFPYCFDRSVTHVRLYMSDSDGGELKQCEDYPIDQVNVRLSALPNLGRAAQFQYLAPMHTGQFLRLWRGRLWTVQRNVLYFSEAMNFHLTDPRYNFIQFPERITFIEPVEGGIWVGQVTHVIFLRGADVRGMSLEHKVAARPVSGSSLFVEHEDLGELAQGGAGCAMWLAENGMVIGTASGQIVEPQRGVIQGITGLRAQCVGFDQKFIALVS